MNVSDQEADADAAGTDIPVLECQLNDQRYCVEIEHVTEIVDERKLIPILDGPHHVVGVMNIREQTTTIVDPRVIRDTETRKTGHRVISFDGDADGQTGYFVDAAERVSTFDRTTVHTKEDNVETSADGETMTGLVQRRDTSSNRSTRQVSTIRYLSGR